MKILIVDDSADMRELMQTLFRPGGHEVSGACDGWDAINQLATKEFPDIIFLDHRMEGLDGPDFLLEMEKRQPALFKRIPIIMITGIEKCEMDGCKATEVLTKPVDIKKLLEIVAKYTH